MLYDITNSVFHIAMCYTVTQPVYLTWQCAIRYHNQCNFTWQYAIRYHNQCISPGNMLYGTTTSVFQLSMCYAVPQPVYFTWQWVMRYHDQCNLAICHTVPQPVYFTWQCFIRYHNQCISAGNVLCGTTTNAFHMAQRLKIRFQDLTRCTFLVTWESSVIFSGYSFWKTTLKKIKQIWQFVQNERML
jgi:hypothetical protein